MPLRHPATARLHLLLAALLLTCAGCAGTGSSARHAGRHAYTLPHVLRYATGSDIQRLNPFVGASGSEIAIATLCMAYFTKLKTYTGVPEPELITVIPSRRNGGVSRDGRTIVWHLRRGVKWSDGAPFDAGDVVFTTKAILDPANHVAILSGWDTIESVGEPDKYTVVYHLAKPYPRFATTFFSTAGSAVAILPQHLLGGVRDLNAAPYNLLPVGIGPFKFASWRRGDAVVMVRNALYFRGPPKLERIIFEAIPNQNTMLAQVRSHELDLWLAVPAHYYTEATAVPGITGSSLPSCGFDHLDFNLTRPVLQDVRVRRALRYAVDRPDLLRVAQHGLYELDESVVAPACRFSEKLPLVPFDLTKAGALLDAAGWKRQPDGYREKDGERLTLVYAEPSGQPDLDIAVELVRGWWRSIGVELTLKRYLPSEFYGDAASGGVLATGRFDVARFSWSFDGDDDYSDTYGCDRFTPHGQNDMHWCDPVATAAMNRASSSSDDAERERDTKILQREAYEQVPTIVLDARRRLAVYNADLKDFHLERAPFDNVLDVDI